MPVHRVLSVSLEVPEIGPGVKFYQEAGLTAEVEGSTARLTCPGRTRPAITLLGGHPRKRLHHVSLAADGLDSIAARASGEGGAVVPAPPGDESDGLWLRDPHGMLFHLEACGPERPLPVHPPFSVNGPGSVVRVRRPAMLPRARCAPVRPLRLGHVLLFTPDVDASLRFATAILGLRLADRSQDVIAFCCAQKNSDHHVLAFAKSSAVGFHHASFEVNDPDEVGRGGRELATKAGRGEWGFGRHTIGSNFFHYIQDPWGSWFEYFSDMDHIDDHALWTPTDFDLEDSLAGWAPPVPDDFVHNYEAADSDVFSPGTAG